MASSNENAILSTRTYPRPDINRTNLPDGWETLIPSDNSRWSGFSASAYRKGTEIVIAYTGTNERKVADFVFANIPSGVGTPNPQVLEAMLFYFEVLDRFGELNPDGSPKYTVSFTGHSLGAGLAGVMAVMFNKFAEGFDPAPFKNTLSKTMLSAYYEKLLDFGHYSVELTQLVQNPNLVDTRANNVIWSSLVGEILFPLRLGLPTIGNEVELVPVGDQSIGMGTLHSMSLFTSLKLSTKLNLSLSLQNGSLSEGLK